MESRDQVVRAVRDTLDSVLSEPVRDTLIEEALSQAGLLSIPELPSELAMFLDGPLRRTLEKALGRELGGAVVSELERLTSPAPPSSGALPANTRSARPGRRRPPTSPRPPRADAPRPRSITLPAGTAPSDAPVSLTPPPLTAAARAAFGRSPTLPATQRMVGVDPGAPSSGDYPTGAIGLASQPAAQAARSSRKLPLLFVATRDVELANRLALGLQARAVSVRVARLMDLLLDIEDSGPRKVVILFDCEHAPVRPEALAAIAEELPPTARVVLWGGEAGLQIELMRLFPAVGSWIVCSRETPVDGVLERCSELVG